VPASAALLGTAPSTLPTALSLARSTSPGLSLASLVNKSQKQPELALVSGLFDKIGDLISGASAPTAPTYKRVTSLNTGKDAKDSSASAADVHVLTVFNTDAEQTGQQFSKPVINSNADILSRLYPKSLEVVRNEIRTSLAASNNAVIMQGSKDECNKWARLMAKRVFVCL